MENEKAKQKYYKSLDVKCQQNIENVHLDTQKRHCSSGRIIQVEDVAGHSSHHDKYAPLTAM